MLNIRISFTVNLKKVWAAGLAGFLLFSHLTAPAYALQVEKQARIAKQVALYERPVTISLTYLTVSTNMTQAKQDLASNGAKYFDSEALAFLMTYTKGWSVKEFKCLDNVWQHESHFNPKALNRSSGSYGIAQFLPSTWGNYKVTKTASAKLQIEYGLRYIQSRYGSKVDPLGACNAWAFWQKHYWY